MDKNAILAKICDVLAEEFECDRAKLVPEAKLFEDLDLDSIDAVDLIVRLQREIDIKVVAEDFKSIRTLGDIADEIDRLVTANAAK